MDKYACTYIFTVEIIFDRKTSNNVVLDSAFTVKHRLHIFCHGWNLQEMGLIQASQAVQGLQWVQLRQCLFFSVFSHHPKQYSGKGCKKIARSHCTYVF